MDEIILKNKNIWITGSARGLGLELAKQFSNLNANIFFGSRYDNDFYTEKGYYTKDFVAQDNVNYIRCDVSDKKSVETAYSAIKEKTNHIDILVNNAGIIETSDLSNITEEHLDKIFRTNLYGAIYSAQSVLPDMISNKFGVIINIISVTAKKSFPYIGAYSASKAAQSSIFCSMREEVRSKGIKIINVYPGAMNTEIWDDKIRNEKGNLMLQESNAAKAIVGISSLCFADELLIEEITIRPQNGDL